MENIKELIQDLDWNKPNHIINKSLKELVKVSDEEAILLADQSNEIFTKYCWYNAAVILKKIGYPRNQLALSYLMCWYRDINWPGVSIITELLKEIDGKILVPIITDAVEIAINQNDSSWASGLLYLIDELRISNSYFSIQSRLSELIELAQTS
jgi:hypothetical protein